MLGRSIGRFDRGLGRRCIAVACRFGRITQAPDGPVPAISVGQRLRDQLIARAISPGNGGREKRFINFRPFEGHAGSISSYGGAALTYRRDGTG